MLDRSAAGGGYGLTVKLGSEDPTIAYENRPSAYVVMRDDSGSLALVRSSGGQFLPGGGLCAGEREDEAVHR
jgi:hypothetical protein